MIRNNKVHVVVTTDYNMHQQIFVYSNKRVAEEHAKAIKAHTTLSVLVFESEEVNDQIPLSGVSPSWCLTSKQIGVTQLGRL